MGFRKLICAMGPVGPTVLGQILEFVIFLGGFAREGPYPKNTWNTYSTQKTHNRPIYSMLIHFWAKFMYQTELKTWKVYYFLIKQLF